MSESDIKTVAIVGCGVGRSHMSEGYLQNADKFKVIAVCDVDEGRLKAFGDDFGVGLRTADFDDLLDMDDLDIIDICTPPKLHFPQIMAALKAGKHVICEKPLVGSLAEMDEVIRTEAESPGKLMPIFQYRYGNGIQQAKAIIEEGLAGKPYVVTAETMWKREPDYYAVPWRGKWKTELGGNLMSHAIHIHDLVTYLMGPISGLFGRIATRVNDIEVEDCASASCILQSGALASLTATTGSHEQISRIRLAFENVTFESDHSPYAPGAAPWKIIPASPEIGAKIEALLADWSHIAPRFQTQFALFHDALDGKAPLPITSADARHALEIITAFYHSSETHTEVLLPIGSEHPKYVSWLPEERA